MRMGQVCRHLEHERFLITDWYTAIVKLSGTRQTFAASTLIGPKTDRHQTTHQNPFERSIRGIFHDCKVVCTA
jgi:hypothetical protein